ncbi:MAG: PD-(D/E)XK nuclease family protein, partial [Elusimicrobia bacterium]|nr:PD-(D/E)XK nuclease family protein [Elusimicrobiota bacterium]
VVRFLSATKARELPENKDESAYPVAPRAEARIPEGLRGLNHQLPKVVFLDMRLFPNGVPYPLIEDMSKLMKTGVYFVLFSDKPNGVVGSVDELLTRQLTVKQRDQISRYKMLILSDDGNSLTGHSGNFARPLPSQRFTPQQLEMMSFVAMAKTRYASVDFKSTRFEVELAKGADAERAKTDLLEGMRGMRLDPDAWLWSVTERGGRAVITARPQSLVSALPHLFEVMREDEGLFVNPSDVMLISRDAGLTAALPGAVLPAQHLGSEGEAFADESLASLLGPYRVNQPGDLAASASKISSFLQGRTGGGFDGGNVYMMTGHVMHSAFNWAVWVYRNTGKLPTAEETVATARKIWEVEVGKGTGKNLLGRPGESLAGLYETVEQRLRAMHQIAEDVLKVYPIAVGTELPNLVVADRLKKGGAADHRDVFRLIFDFVVARETKDGKLEVVIVDFKTGQVPTLQNLEKDTQVQLYDLLVRRMWPTMRLPYGGTGAFREVADYKLNFLYTAGAYQPSLNDWSRLKFDKFLKNVMNRIRNFNNPKPPKDDAKKAKTAKK